MPYILLLTIVFLLLSCAAPRVVHQYSEDNTIAYEQAAIDGASYPAPRPARAMALKSSVETGGSLGRGTGMFVGGRIADYGEGDMVAEPSTGQVRMVNYNGSITMQSAEPEVLIDTVANWARAKGGSISNRRNGHISLQIPVAEFRNFFNQILKLGRVTSKNISASDITEAYADNAARLSIAESTLARLQHLLAAAKTEQEKIALLKEIQRVSEQIEQRKLDEKELLRQAAFSTINLWVSNIPAVIPYRANIKAFEWFSNLPNNLNRGKALKLSIPKDFIETADTKREWSTASALNAKFSAFERKNEPKGTTSFWAEAMLEFFKLQYAVELKTEENFSLIRLQNFGTEPEVHYIALLKKSDEKTLRIAVAYFPNVEAEKKNAEAVLEVLRGVK